MHRSYPLPEPAEIAWAQGFPFEQDSPQFTVGSSSSQGNKNEEVTREQRWLPAELGQACHQARQLFFRDAPTCNDLTHGNIHLRHKGGERHRWDQLWSWDKP